MKECRRVHTGKIPDFTAVCMCIYNTHRSTIAAVTFTSQKKI